MLSPIRRPRASPWPPRPTAQWASVGLLTILAIVFTAALTFVSVELPRWLTRLADPWITIPDYHPAIEPAAIEAFLDSSLVRPIGYACLALVLALVALGFATRRRSLSTLGAILIVLPTFGYFAGYMFFLGGLGVLRALWLPAWSDGLALGDVAYVPYMAVVWPLWQLGVDVRQLLASAAIAIGLFVFVSATVGWLADRVAGRRRADSWLYRHSRHPQYLGWIVWSWGFMVLAGLQPVPMAGENPGAALPWLLSTAVIVGIAWSEEVRMVASVGADYVAYRRRTPFLIPLPRGVGRAIGAPMRWVLRTDLPQTGRQVLLAVAIYLGLALCLSLPFVILSWPPYDWWGWPQWGLPSSPPAPVPAVPH